MFINQVKDFKNIDDLNNFLKKISTNDIVRITAYSGGYFVIYKINYYD